MTQVFVAGTWSDTKAEPFAAVAHRVGRLLAEAGVDLACGPGTGIAGHVVAGYRSVAGRAGKVRYYLPTETAMRAAGEEVRPGADEIEQTDLDYPMRNVYQVSRSQGLVVLGGGDGTLEEIITAIVDYHLPVAVLQGSGKAPDALERLLDVFPDWRDGVLFGDDPDKLVGFVMGRMHKAAG